MRCICSFEKQTEDDWKKVDSWEEALGKTYNTNGKYLKMYRKLHNDVCRFFSRENVSFENVRSAWFNFKANFIDENDFSSDANKILGRCLSELESIIAIEKDYADTGLTVENPFQFYLNLLNSKSYTSQSADKGISVFPYKLSAGAYFKYQFVIDGSQKNIEVPYKPLAFLNSEQRKKLKLAEDERLYNATGTIIRLYAKTSDGADENFVHFSASENTFSGFSIPHSALEIEEKVPDQDDADFNLAEKHWIENGAKEPMKISGSQKNQLEKWINAALEKDSDYRINEEIRKKIDYHFVESKNLSLDRKKIAVSEKCRAMNKISARSDMEKFFPCPRKWIFSQILKFQEDSLSTDLMTPYDMGSLHHKILEKFMDLYKDKALPFFNNGSFFEKNENSQELNSNNDVTLRIQNLLYGTNDEPGLVEKSIKAVSNDFSDSPLVIMTLMSQKNNIANTIMAFLENLLESYSVESEDEMPKDISGIGNCTVVSVEDTYVSEMEKFAYYGKIDCVVKTPDTKQLVLLDYKNSTTSFPAGFKANENGILEDYQMTVYCRLLCKDCAKELAASYFYAIKDCKRLLVFDKYKENQVDSKGNPKKDENYAAFEPSVKICDEYADVMNKIVSAESPDFSPKTSKNLKNRQNVKRYIDCAGCNYKEVCRTTYSVAGKQLKTEKQFMDVESKMDNENKYKYLGIIERALDPAQSNVCFTTENAVIAAGAGSGKTQVLATRFAWLVISKDVKASEILTLTFTDKAASEMYQRIYATLKYFAEYKPKTDEELLEFFKIKRRIENPTAQQLADFREAEKDLTIVKQQQARDALLDFTNAHIQTLDSYCGSIVRQCANRYGITPAFSVGSGDGTKDIKDMAFRFALKNINASAFLEFSKPGRIKEFASAFFADTVINHTSVATPDGYFSKKFINQKKAFALCWNKRFAENRTDSFFSQIFDIEAAIESDPAAGTPAKQLWAARVRDCISYARVLVDSITPIDESHFENDMERIQKQVQQLEKFFDLLDIARGTKGAINAIKSQLKALNDNVRPDLCYISYFVRTYSLQKQMMQLMDSFLKEVNQKKRNTGALTFSDVTELALKILLENEDIRNNEKNAYKKIMIDEFQDNNSKNRDLLYLLSLKPGAFESNDGGCVIEIDDSNPESLHNQIVDQRDSEKLFFVGDEKQSIYKFRDADVSVFNKLTKENKKVAMSYNYRSTPELVNAFNIFFKNENGIFVSQYGNDEDDFEAH